MSVCNRNFVIVGNPTLKTSNYPPELNMSPLIALKSKYVTLVVQTNEILWNFFLSAYMNQINDLEF